MVSPRTITLLTPLFRRSEGRQAWVLRLVGGRFGPVLISKDQQLAIKGPEAWATHPVPREVGAKRGS